MGVGFDQRRHQDEAVEIEGCGAFGRERPGVADAGHPTACKGDIGECAIGQRHALEQQGRVFGWRHAVTYAT